MIPDLCRLLDVSEQELIHSSVDTESRTLAAYAYGLLGVLTDPITGNSGDAYAVDFRNRTACSNGNTLVLVMAALILTALILFLSGCCLPIKYKIGIENSRRA